MRRLVRLLFVVRDEEIISDSSLARCSEMLWWGGLGVVKRREMIAFRRKQGRRWLLPLLSWSSILSLQMIWLFCRTWWWVVMSDDDNKVVIWCWMRDDTDDCLVKFFGSRKDFGGSHRCIYAEHLYEKIDSQTEPFEQPMRWLSRSTELWWEIT